VELVERCSTATLAEDGGHYTVEGDGWVVCVVG